jgi:DNA-binding CsgD family transcriptional regulator
MASVLASQTLRWGRSVLLEQAAVESTLTLGEIAITLQREAPHAALDGDSELTVAFERSVTTMFDFGLQCVRCGPEFARKARFPEAPLASARLAGSHDVPLEVVIGRHVMGSEVFWGWVADVIQSVTFSYDRQIEDNLRFALLEETRSMQATLVSRVLREVPPAHARGARVLRSPEFDLSQLTERERQVFALLQDAFSDKEIAMSLEPPVSESTARSYVRDVLRKVGVTDRRRVRRRRPPPSRSHEAGDAAVTRLSFVRLASSSRRSYRFAGCSRRSWHRQRWIA